MTTHSIMQSSNSKPQSNEYRIKSATNSNKSTHFEGQNTEANFNNNNSRKGQSEKARFGSKNTDERDIISSSDKRRMARAAKCFLPSGGCIMKKQGDPILHQPANKIMSNNTRILNSKTHVTMPRTKLSSITHRSHIKQKVKPITFYEPGHYHLESMKKIQQEKRDYIPEEPTEPYRNIGIKPPRPPRFIPNHPVYEQYPGSTIYKDEQGYTVVRTSFTIEAEKQLLKEQAEQDRLDQIKESERPYIDKLADRYQGAPFIGLSGRLYGAKHIKFKPIPPEIHWARFSKSEHDRLYETKLRPEKPEVRPPPETYNVRSHVRIRNDKEKERLHLKLKKTYKLLRKIRKEYGYDALYSPVTPADRIDLMVIRNSRDCPSRKLAKEAIRFCEKDGVDYPLGMLKTLNKTIAARLNKIAKAQKKKKM